MRVTDNLPLVAMFPWKGPRGKKYPFLVLNTAYRRDPHDPPDVPDTQYVYPVTRYMDSPVVLLTGRMRRPASVASARLMRPSASDVSNVSQPYYKPVKGNIRKGSWIKINIWITKEEFHINLTCQTWTDVFFTRKKLSRRRGERSMQTFITLFLQFFKP